MLYMLRHIAFSGMLAFFCHDAGRIVEPVVIGRKCIQFFLGHQVIIIGNAKYQVNGVMAAGNRQTVEHGQERGDAGAASQKQGRADNRA